MKNIWTCEALKYLFLNMHLPANGARCWATYFVWIVKIHFHRPLSVRCETEPLEAEGRAIRLLDQWLCRLPVRSAVLRSASGRKRKVASVCLLPQVTNPMMTHVWRNHIETWERRVRVRLTIRQLHGGLHEIQMHSSPHIRPLLLNENGYSNTSVNFHLTACSNRAWKTRFNFSSYLIIFHLLCFFFFNPSIADY